MKGISYRIIQEKFRIADVGNYTSYGIALCKNGKQEEKISDISSSFFSVLSLCIKCNILGVRREHFADVIEDFVAKC